MNNNYRQGYSLIELTIVVGLVSILSITISAIVLSTIVNGNRIRSQVRVRQAGDYAIGQLNTMIHNAKSIEACSNTNNTFTLKNQDNLQTAISLGNVSADTGQVASNSAYLTPSDLKVASYDVTCLPDETKPKLINISFTLSKSGTAVGKTIENPTVKFSTSAALRN